MFFSAHSTGVPTSPVPGVALKKAPSPVYKVVVLFNEHGDAFFDKGSVRLSDEEIRAYESTVVRDCGKGYVLAPCTREEARHMTFGRLALECEEYGSCEYVPVCDIPLQIKPKIQLAEIRTPSDEILLGARLHREHRLSHGAMSHAARLMLERAGMAPSERFLGLLRSKYPKIFLSELSLSPAQLRGQAPLPPQDIQQAPGPRGGAAPRMHPAAHGERRNSSRE